MCMTCGCSETANTRVTNLTPGHTGETTHTHSHHSHAHDEQQHHDQDHHHDHRHQDYQRQPGTTVPIEQAILAKNDRLAERNRRWFLDKNIVALNLLSSPGSGKTTLLERTIQELKHVIHISVIEGDQETRFDAERIRKTGSPVVQINTGTGCHLEAGMLARGLEALQPLSNSLVMIENVGNLVCPALFDLGEHARVVILSVTEGEDKPLKYPHMFKKAGIMILNKIDLLPHLKFDVSKCVEFAHVVNPELQVFQVSATTGEGLQNWYDWVTSQIKIPGHQDMP